jgi:hypothetical protein
MVIPIVTVYNQRAAGRLRPLDGPPSRKQAFNREFGGQPPQASDPEQAKPEPKARRNYTDPDSRTMKDGATIA